LMRRKRRRRLKGRVGTPTVPEPRRRGAGLDEAKLLEHRRVEAGLCHRAAVLDEQMAGGIADGTVVPGRNVVQARTRNAKGH
jgi:hypothetical protein